MRVLEAGAGEPVVLLHPFPLDANYWSPQLAAPPAGWRLIAPDFRGFGTQGAGDAPVASLDDYARDVLAMLDARRIERAVVAGVSMGGYVAFAMLRLAPRRVRALVLANTRMDADPPEGRANRQKMLDLLAREGSAGIARNMPPLLGATTERDRPELEARLRAVIEAAPAPAIEAAVRAMLARPGSEPQLAAFPAPALIVSGEEDTLTPPPLQQAMLDVMAHARLERIPGAGHLASLEKPAEFNEILQRFLHSLSR